MILTGVTLTGADDSVDPRKLVELSQRFPFVEWGILIGSRAGSPRFPSEDWIRRLFNAEPMEDRVDLSLHICGKHLRNVIGGIDPDLTYDSWDRCQLNFHGEKISEDQAASILKAVDSNWIPSEVIIQLDGENDFVLDYLTDNGMAGAMGLYDRSHGAGVLPGEWPKANPRWEVGYAGGLGPDNVTTELRRIADAAGGQRFWIDMETKLRSDSGRQFDLHKCQCVLEECEQFFPRLVR